MWPLSSKGGGSKALVAGPLKNNFFCCFPKPCRHPVVGNGDIDNCKGKNARSRAENWIVSVRPTNIKPNRALYICNISNEKNLIDNKNKSNFKKDMNNFCYQNNYDN